MPPFNPAPPESHPASKTKNSPKSQTFTNALQSIKAAPTQEKAMSSLGEEDGDVKTLLYKHQDIINIFAKLHELEPFARNSLSPKQLVDSKRTIWGILKPFVTGGYQQIIYLASSLPSPLVEDEDLEALPEGELALRVQKLLKSAKKEAFSPKIASILVEGFDAAFHEVLGSQMPFFGQVNSSQWTESFGVYCEKLLEPWEDNDYGLSDQETEILQLLPSKLEALLIHRAMDGYPFIPHMHGLVPLFCPEFLLGLYEEIQAITPVLSLISGWIVPGLSYIHRQIGTRSNPFSHSETESLFLHLQYFQHHNTAGFDWAYSSVAKVASTTFGDETISAGHALHNLWFKMIAHILEHRTTVLVPSIPDIHHALAASSLDSKLIKEEQIELGLAMDSKTTETVTNFMVKWANVSLRNEKEKARKRKSKFLKPELRLRHLQQCPLEIPPNIPKKLAKGLQASSFNWFVSEACYTNTPVTRKRYAESLYTEAIQNKQYNGPLVRANHDLYSFRQQLLRLINECSGLESFTFWYSVKEPEPLATHAEVSFDDTHLGDLIKTRSEVQQMRASFSTFCGTLSKGVCGAQIFHDDGSRSSKGIHPALEGPLYTLFETMVQVQQETNDGRQSNQIHSTGAKHRDWAKHGLKMKFAQMDDSDAANSFSSASVSSSRVSRKRPRNGNEDVDENPAAKRRRGTAREEESE
ncbi:hypothetical protein DFH06DRAFT_1194068 [Mycena polygramma]|nr:hypothetical protein DFH06DRAFT_1194068 [Mycena polygramma]